MKFFIKTFGCQQNSADSSRIKSAFMARGITEAKDYKNTNYVVINTCMVRESAENRVYGLVNNLAQIKKEKEKRNIFYKIIVTGCMVGLAYRDSSGKYLSRLHRIMPCVDEFAPIEEVGFDNQPIQKDNKTALVPISNGCNNFCTFCVVPFTRGREISRPFEQIVNECRSLRKQGYKNIMLLGQNVNSYGADLILGRDNIQVMRDLHTTYFSKKTIKKNHYVINGRKLKPVYVSHLGRQRLPTLFPHLLESVAQLGFDHIDFLSSNPWDFSDELIRVIAKHSNITRTIHLPMQSGDNQILKKMNRWYTREQYLELIQKIQKTIRGVSFTTDIIVGFCTETDKAFLNTYDLCKRVGFKKAYISIYSQRPFTAATKVMQDDIPHSVKKKRWKKLNALINKKQTRKQSES